MNPAGLGIRVVSGFLDLIVLAIPFCVFVTFLAVCMNVWDSFFFEYHPGQPLPPDLVQKGPTLIRASIFFYLLTSWLYFAFLESSPWRATIGKHFLGLYLADEQGDAITFWQATKRFLGGRFLLHLPTVGLLYILIDCLCIKALPRHQAVHDRLAHCLVLQEPSTLNS
jgi:uncharacterized RDD family membrane protein YckC